MIPRPTKVYHIQIKTHKLTIMLADLDPSTPISELKTETLSALKSKAGSDALDVTAIDPPEINVETVDDFELCRGKREKGKLTGEYDILEPSKKLRECGLTGWEAIFLQFKDRDTGTLQPITYILPPLIDEDDEPQPGPTAAAVGPSVNTRKRKAADDEIEN